MALTPTTRFSDRAEDYSKYRPGYPDDVLNFCRREMGMTSSWGVADIGSGTGLLTRKFLEAGHPVYAVEPNGPMRGMAERALKGFPGFTSIDGSAEATTLPSRSVHLWTAGTAFHWFDPEGSRKELLRIVRPGAWAMLIWNLRNSGENPATAAYDALLAARPDTHKDRTPGRSQDRAKMAILFGTDQFLVQDYPNFQVLDFDELRGRMLSSSSCPKPGNPQFEPLEAGLRQLFQIHERAGKVRLDYITRIYAAPIAAS
jgi:SAM-dependent methyltransferase